MSHLPRPSARVCELFMLSGVSICYVSISSSLISFNKFLMSSNRFPFAVVLACLHMTTCFVLCSVLYVFKPSWFPFLQNLNNDAAKKYAWYVLPVSGFFAGTLVLSNHAYLYCSLAFLQMMKEGNLVFIYLGSLFIGLEKSWSWRIVGLLAVIGGGTLMTIYGELRFVLLGFIIQLSSQLCEVGKILLQNKVLSKQAEECKEEEEKSAKKDDSTTCEEGFEQKSLLDKDVTFSVIVMDREGTTEEGDQEAVVVEHDKKVFVPKKNVKMDPLSFVMLVSPCCLPFLLTKLYLFQWQPALILGHMREHYFALICNCLIAFSLNVSIAFFLKLGTALSFIVCGVAKDVLIVLVGVCLFEEQISMMQKLGFLLQMAGICMYSGVRSFPEKFPENQYIVTFLLEQLLCLNYCRSDSKTIHREDITSVSEETTDYEKNPLLSTRSDLNTASPEKAGRLPSSITSTNSSRANSSGFNSEVQSEVEESA